MDYTNFFKSLLVLFISSFIPVTIFSFLLVRRTKKEAEFTRVVQVLGIASDDAEFARDRVTEQYAGSNYRLPVLFAWLMSILGLVSLLFGVDLVETHLNKPNFLLTGNASFADNNLQPLRLQSMMVMSLAFLGAFLWSTQNILRRLNAGDLSPSVYFSAGVRMTLAPVLSLMVSHVLRQTNAEPMTSSSLPAIAFLVGIFPDEALQFLKEKLHVFSLQSRSAHDLPLSMIEGMGVYHRARLAEVGVEDAQNLASANFIELVVRTSFNPNQIIDWIAQARLYVYFKDDIVALRRCQIRSVLDLLPACQDEKLLQEIAGATGLEQISLHNYCNILTRDLSVKQLLSFQERLCTIPRRPVDNVATDSGVAPKDGGPLGKG